MVQSLFYTSDLITHVCRGGVSARDETGDGLCLVIRNGFFGQFLWPVSLAGRYHSGI